MRSGILIAKNQRYNRITYRIHLSAISYISIFTAYQRKNQRLCFNNRFYVFRKIVLKQPLCFIHFLLCLKGHKCLNVKVYLAPKKKTLPGSLLCSRIFYRISTFTSAFPLKQTAIALKWAKSPVLYFRTCSFAALNSASKSASLVSLGTLFSSNKSCK